MRGSHVQVILLIVLWCATESFAAEADSAPRRGWDIQPHGRAWSEFYSPPDSAMWWDFGLDLTMWYRNPSRFSPFMYLQIRTQAGYEQNPDPKGPPTPVDLLHQIWQQGLGIEWQGPVPLYLFAYRDCNHQLDKSVFGFQPVLSTTIMAAAGTLAPFRRDFQNARTSFSRWSYAWLAAAGPAPMSGDKSMWQSESALQSEAWVRVFGSYQLWKSGVLDTYAELIAQRSGTGPNVRHVLRNDLGLTILTGERAWRFFLGRRWRDTRELWPVDQRTYFGLEYSY